ncbi:hypothetical protein [Blautia obeum]|nr:hypothetical protein [Blautia obeum]
MVSESVIVLVSRADTVQEKSLKNLESEGILDPEQIHYSKQFPILENTE